MGLLSLFMMYTEVRSSIHSFMHYFISLHEFNNNHVTNTQMEDVYA